jgi:hypothetical protein
VEGKERREISRVKREAGRERTKMRGERQDAISELTKSDRQGKTINSLSGQAR